MFSIYVRPCEGVDRIPAMIQDGYIGLMSNGVTPTAPAFSIYHDPEFKPEEFDYEIAYPVPEGTPPLETPAGRKFSERVVPGGKLGVLVHRGPYEDMDEAYGRIGQWITDNGLQIAGPPQEAYLTAPDDPAGLDHRDPLAGVLAASASQTGTYSGLRRQSERSNDGEHRSQEGLQGVILGQSWKAFAGGDSAPAVPDDRRRW